MKRYHRLQFLAAVFLAAQMTVGYAGWLTPRREIYPFASWALFVLVPNRSTEYDLLLHGPAGEPRVPPALFKRADGLVHAPHSIVSYQLIQQLGNAIEHPDPDRADYLRRQIEEQFAVPAIRYDLIKVKYLPVPRWKTGEILSKRTLCSFVATELPLKNPDQPPPLERDPDAASGAPLAISP